MHPGIHFREHLKQAVAHALHGDDESRVLLLSCIDLRYPHRISDAMDSEGYRGRYYHLAMAGASHAARHDSNWAKTFEDHIQFAVNHGHVTGVVILDHLDCKAYQLYEGVAPGDLETEMEKHRASAAEVVSTIVDKFPTLKGHVHAMLLPVEPEPLRPELLSKA